MHSPIFLRMRKFVLLVVVAIAPLNFLAAPSISGPSFTVKPSAKRVGTNIVVSFAADRETDVAIWVEDEKGKVVRHLAAGRLGSNAPEPLKPNSLQQTVLWDGKDDFGKPLPSDQRKQAIRIRVGLGLRAEFDRVVISDNQTISGVNSLAVGPDGVLYVVMNAGGTGPVWSGQIMLAYNREGKFLRQVMPFPDDLAMDQVAGFDVIEMNGRPVPLVHDMQAHSFYAGQVPRKAGMAVTKDGVLITMLGPCNLGALDGRGAAAWGRYLGPSLLPSSPRARMTSRPFVAVSSDSRWAYVSGLVEGSLDEKGNLKTRALTAVYRLPLPERSPAERFFGDPARTGSDNELLGGPPHGLAVDGKGHLLIADRVNERIVAVGERDGRVVSILRIGEPTSGEVSAGQASRGKEAGIGPDCVAVDPVTGAVYVTRLTGRGGVELLKFSGLNNSTPVARLSLPGSGNPDFPWLMTVDFSARPPILWLGSDAGSLLRIEDAGDAFSAPKDISTRTIGNGSFVDLSVDRSRNEVYTRCGMGQGSYWWFRFSEETGEVKKITLSPIPSAAGSQMVPGPNGCLYCPAYPYHLLKFDRDGKPLPWAVEERYPRDRVGKGEKIFTPQPLPHGRYVPVSMTFLTHTLGIRHDGHIFMFEPGRPGDRPPKMLIEYLPDGTRVGEPIIWKVSDTAVGPKFDFQGNIYIAEQVKPADQPYPPEFGPLVGKVELQKTYLEGIKDVICSMYGSIVKFSPKGGMIHWGGENPFEGEPRLDPSLQTMQVAAFHGHRLQPIKITGALWIHMGISHVDLIPCNCENTRFDVDGFGRVFYPDLGRFRIGVVDTNGNKITEFGRYGNANTTNDLAFTWLIGVATTDRYAYMGDSLNRRLSRARLSYASEEVCPVPD
ncbi:MAG: hypothetical protein N2255_10070 [Kiritimatiellae bacterium]|nr:hypothetical protein [Kiritimatiellia bacterium]